MSVATLRYRSTRRQTNTSSGNVTMSTVGQPDYTTREVPGIPIDTYRYLQNHDVDIHLSQAVFTEMAALYGFLGSFPDFLTWAVTYLRKAEHLGLQFEGLRTNQTELLPAASFRAGGGVNVQIQTGCRMSDASPDPIRPFEGLHIVSTDNSNMSEDQLEVFREELGRFESVTALLQHYKGLNLHFVIRSAGSSWDNRLCYNFEFSLIEGEMTAYTRAERNELCRKAGAILDEPGELPGLERPLVGDICGALLGLWISETATPLPRDGNVEANAVIKRFASSSEKVNNLELIPISWFHVSRALAHATAGTRCAYALACGRAVASTASASYATLPPLDQKTRDYVWHIRSVISLSLQLATNLIAIIVVAILGKSSGFEIEWLAIAVSLTAHLTTWISLAANKLVSLRLRSWSEAERHIKRSKVLKLIVSGRLKAVEKGKPWTLCDSGFDVSGLYPTIKELEDAGAKIYGLTNTCSIVLFEHAAGIVSKECETSDSCYMRPTTVPLKSIKVSEIMASTTVKGFPD